MKIFFSLSVLFLVATLSAQQQPNVLFIAVDDMNDWIGVLGKEQRAVTPNIDRLAQRGVCFTNAHTPGVYCAPARTAIFTGQFASTTGCYANQPYQALLPDLVPLQVSFAQAGYAVFGTGKLFHHRQGYIDQRGWTEFHVRSQWQREAGWPMESWEGDVPLPQPFPYGIYSRKVDHKKSGFMEWGPLANDQEGAMADSRRADYAISKLQDQHNQPFFIGVGLYSPHFPLYCPQKYFDLYDKDSIAMPALKADDHTDLPMPIRRSVTRRHEQYQAKLEQWDAHRDVMQAYLACISYADAQIGRVLDALDASPYADNTIVVLWSDHGYHLGEKGHWGKHELWERTTNVPFIWAGPGIARGQMPEVSVSLIDMFPTFVERCGLPAPTQTLEGHSLAATLADPSTAGDRDIYVPYKDPKGFALVNREWRYIQYPNGTEELYDVQADPNEWTNLAANPEHQATLEAFRAKGPAEFAEPLRKPNLDTHLIVEGEGYRWDFNPKHR